MTDTFADHVTDISSPPSNAVQVTPSDTTDLAYVTRAIYVGTQGDVRLLTHEGQDIIYKDLIGTKVIRAARIFSTGTTAGSIVAEW